MWACDRSYLIAFLCASFVHNFQQWLEDFVHRIGWLYFHTGSGFVYTSFPATVTAILMCSRHKKKRVNFVLQYFDGLCTFDVWRDWKVISNKNQIHYMQICFLYRSWIVTLKYIWLIHLVQLIWSNYKFLESPSMRTQNQKWI